MKQPNGKQAGEGTSGKSPDAAGPPVHGSRTAPPQRSKEARNKANTIRNSVKVEHYLMEVEKVHGFAKSWALRERLEQGHISLDDLMRR